MAPKATRRLREEFFAGDRELVEFLRREGPANIQEMVTFAGVTATAVRQRLARLMQLGLIIRESERSGRGRPTHRYSLSRLGVRSSGNNYEDLVTVLWDEIRSVKDPDVRYGLLRRIVTRMAEVYRDKIKGETIKERLQSLIRLMRERNIPFELVETENGQLPVLKALACPYPGLAEQDRVVCSMEKMLFTEILGDGLKLKDCRLDGDQHCTFEMKSPSTASV